MPTRSSLLVHRPRPAAPRPGSTPRLPASMPRPIAQVRTPTGGHELVSEHRATEPERGREQSRPAAWPCGCRSDSTRLRGIASAAGRCLALDGGHPGGAVSRDGELRPCRPPARRRASSTSMSGLGAGQSPYPEAGLRWPTAPMSMNRLPQASASARTRSESPSGSLVLAATMLGNGSGCRGMGSQPSRSSSSSDGYSGGQRPGQVRRAWPAARRGPAGRAAGPSARWPGTPALWATMVTGPSASWMTWCEVGDPAGQVALVPAERAARRRRRAAWRRAGSASGPRRARGGPAR